MFFSNKEFYDALVRENSSFNYMPAVVVRASRNARGQIDRRKADAVLKKIKDAIVLRQQSVRLINDNYYGDSMVYLTKFTRPWDVIPRLRQFTPPEGDFSVGVEVEYGFASHEAAREAVMTIRNWKNVAVDTEGGIYGVEATFPPLLYSKLRSNSPVFRYIKYLESIRGQLAGHRGQVGTHVNVGTSRPLTFTQTSHVTILLQQLTAEENRKYFGRMPYGYLFNHDRFVEYKLFNSCNDVATVKCYINIAVSLSKLMDENRASPYGVTIEQVREALERGYAGRVK